MIRNVDVSKTKKWPPKFHKKIGNPDSPHPFVGKIFKKKMFCLVGQNFDKNLNKASASKFQLYSRLKQERWYLQQPESHSSILNECTQGGKDTGKPITIMIVPGSDKDQTDFLQNSQNKCLCQNHHLSESQKGGFPFSSRPKGNFWQQLFGWR